MFLSFSLFLGVTLITFSQDRERESEDTKGNYRDTTKKEFEEVETEEIVVTGTRTSKQIIDIPFSVFRIGKREIRYGRNFTARDVLADVPGLFLQTRFGSDVRISIRGYGTRSNSTVRGIRILLDGIPESDPDGESTMDAVDYTSIGGVEVVKGNLSSIYTNSPGGVINFLTDIFFNESFVTQNNEIGSFGLHQNGIKLGLKSEKSRYFLSYFYRNFDGYRPHSTEYVHLLNSIFQLYPDTKTSVTLLGNYARGFTRFPGALTKEEFDADPFQPYFQSVSSDIKRITQRGRAALRYFKTFGKKDANELELTGFGSIKDFDFTTNDLYNIKTKYSLGVNLRYTNKSPVFKHSNEFSVGADYFYVTGSLSSYTNIGGIKQNELQFQSQETQINLGAYLLDQYSLYKDRFYALFSCRYDKVEFENDDLLAGDRSSSVKFEKFTPKLALNFKLMPLVAVYSSYGYAFDMPAAAEMENSRFSSNNGRTTLNPDLKPQNSKNYELGIKGNFFQKKIDAFEKVYFEFTFFNIKVDDEIIPFSISDKPYFKNAARTNRTGLECTIKSEPLERMEWIVNYTFANFKYDSYHSQTIDSVGNIIDVNYTGNTVPAVPRHLFNFILNYQYQLSKDISGLVLFDCDYVSRMFTDDGNTETTPPYFYANSLFGVNLSIKKFSALFSAGVNNIFNRRYVGYININANPEFRINQRRYYEPGEPRFYYVNLNFRYSL
jgi:iron complex outermembrane recepter protein